MVVSTVAGGTKIEDSLVLEQTGSQATNNEVGIVFRRTDTAVNMTRIRTIIDGSNYGAGLIFSTHSNATKPNYTCSSTANSTTTSSITPAISTSR